MKRQAGQRRSNSLGATVVLALSAIALSPQGVALWPTVTQSQRSASSAGLSCCRDGCVCGTAGCGLQGAGCEHMSGASKMAGMDHSSTASHHTARQGHRQGDDSDPPARWILTRADCAATIQLIIVSHYTDWFFSDEGEVATVWDRRPAAIQIAPFDRPPSRALTIDPPPPRAMC